MEPDGTEWLLEMCETRKKAACDARKVFQLLHDSQTVLIQDLSSTAGIDADMQGQLDERCRTLEALITSIGELEKKLNKLLTNQTTPIDAGEVLKRILGRTINTLLTECESALSQKRNWVNFKQIVDIELQFHQVITLLERERLFVEANSARRARRRAAQEHTQHIVDFLEMEDDSCEGE